MRETPFSVEECRERVPSQYELCVMAANRAIEIKLGKTMVKVPLEEGETHITAALKEIAAGIKSDNQPEE